MTCSHRALELPGFADPVGGAQACFRALLDAMARPGTIHELASLLAPPAPLSPAAASVLLALVDADTPLWLDPSAAAAWDWLSFHSGAALTRNLEEAAFAMALAMPPLASLAPGSDLAPEDSATLVCEVSSLGEGQGYRLAGPGLRAPALLRVAGLPANFAAQWAANHALYPRGVDLVLCAGKRLAALPRSVRVEKA